MKKSLLVFTILFFCFAAPKAALAATLSLSPTSLTKNVGETFVVDIVLDPGTDSVSAASAIVNYDTTKLTAVSVTQGALFNQTPLTNTIDTTLGQIRYDSGSLGAVVTARGVMASVTFRAVAAGTATTTIVFDPVATTGTSLIAASTGPTNLLTAVNNGVYTIVASGATTTTTTPTYYQYSMPATGVVENTIVAVIGGVAFLASGLFLARKYFYAQQ